MNRAYVKILKALGDPNRIRIVKMLSERQLCLCEVREILGLSNSTVSKHLSILRDAGILLDSKDGKWVNFQLNVKPEQRFTRSIIDLLQDSFDDDETIQEDLKLVRTVDRRKICGI
jgi:ArsR family transcriptional regulator